MNITLTFDIETVPDVAGIRLLRGGSEDDEILVQQAFAEQEAKTGKAFLPLHLHKVVAIAVCLRWKDKIKIGTLGDPNATEAEIINRFYQLIDEHTPQLVSWNGNGFDLPVLQYRALMHGITAKQYWNTQGEFKYNNYTSRYHTRHCDLMDTLALYQGKAFAPMDEIAKLCGFAGKLGMDGSQVWGAYCQGKMDDIRHYCETDSANTYLLYLRHLLMTGALEQNQYEQEVKLLKNWVNQQDSEHWKAFAKAW